VAASFGSWCGGESTISFDDIFDVNFGYVK